LADTALTQSWSQKIARLSEAYHARLFILAVAFCVFALVSQERFLTLSFGACACVLIFFLISRIVQGPELVVQEHIDLSYIEELCTDDLLPTFVSALNGDILWQNRSAKQAAGRTIQFAPSIAAFFGRPSPQCIGNSATIVSACAGSRSFHRAPDWLDGSLGRTRTDLREQSTLAFSTNRQQS